MKYIFDFDDVIFYATKRRYESTYPKLKKIGISHKDIDDYYNKNRENLFTIKKLLAHFNLDEEYYAEMMHEIEDFKNMELVEIIKNLGKENCYIISFGDEEFQLDKIKRTGIADLFSEIIIVQGPKKEAIEKIASQYKNETIIFIDDKVHHFEDLDLVKHPNLKTVHFTNNAQLHDALPDLFLHK